MKKSFFVTVLLALLGAGVVCADETAELALTKITLYTSGVGFFEHSGSVRGDVTVDVPFQTSAVNDALKSLVILDAASKTPQVSYPAENTLLHTLRSLKIDLSGNPGIAEILASLKGEEIEVAVPGVLKGRIMGIEQRYAATMQGELTEENFLSLSTPQGIRVINLKDIASFSFADVAINADLGRALDLLQQSHNDETRVLQVRLPGETGGSAARPVTMSYVVPTPVWKTSYRLDLSAKTPGVAATSALLQGWAIIDNDSDRDWKGVTVSLVTGRPVSFVQNLYAPYYLYRPTVPLAIAGAAEAATFDSGVGRVGHTESALYAQSPAPKPSAPTAMSKRSMNDMASEDSITLGAALTGGTLNTAEGRAAGEQFEFTLTSKLTLPRRQSAMAALVEGTVTAEKTLVLSGSKAASGSANPSVAVEITNNTGMKLPAGPVTVYDSNTYAGDALVDFFPEGAKRLIGYGDDLSVTGSASTAFVRDIDGVTMSRGVMTITRRQIFERRYRVQNNSADTKQLIIEHPLTPDTTLAEPAAFVESTASLYRFKVELKPKGETVLVVKEVRPLKETVVLADMNFDTLLRYSTDQQISDSVKAALRGAVERKLAVDEAQVMLTELSGRRAIQIAEQDRIRRNLEAAGNTSPQGQAYLARLTALDIEIDTLREQIGEAALKLQGVKNAYAKYVGEMEL